MLRLERLIQRERIGPNQDLLIVRATE
jgi:hypothetical protein